MADRFAQAHEILKTRHLDSLLVTNPTNIFYLTGFRGVSPTEREALLVVKKPKNILITAKLYQAEAKKVASNNLTVKIAAERNEYEDFIKESLNGIKRLGFEQDDLKFSEYKKFKKYHKDAKFIPTNNLIEDLRSIKSNDEIQYITRAQLITQKVFNEIIKTIKIGQTEAEIAQRLKSITHHFTHQSLAFEPIVASGPNSARPHYTTGKRKIKNGDILLFDFGATYKNYCADFSRTVFIGKANSQQQKIHELVFNSQQAAIKTIKGETLAKKVFESSHKVFRKARLDRYFIHSLGHGIGLEVHEKPSLSRKSKDTLKPGMVFSVEPGLYFPWGGVRIEDLVLVLQHKGSIIGKSAIFIEVKP